MIHQTIPTSRIKIIVFVHLKKYGLKVVDYLYPVPCVICYSPIYIDEICYNIVCIYSLTFYSTFET